ncbi:hypothetical protein OG285_36395 (plasmid) [Streptomyces sp. NBC_01471]|uniref:hypothetical protein n=1 Tax=Streptomyces sp. NBC_01471 TaxID=2903879 RepID=UPI002F91199C
MIAAVGFAVLLSGMVSTMRVAYPAGEALKVAGQTIVTPDGTPGNTDEVVADNPVGKAALPTRAFVETKSGNNSEQPTASTVLDVLGSRDARWDKQGEAVLGEKTAGALGLKRGQEVPVRFADGATVTLRVSQVLPDDPARGDFVVARGLVRAHDPAALTDDIFVPGDARASAVAPGVALHDAAGYALADYTTDAKLTESLAMMLIVIAVGYSVIAVANSMAMAAHGRRHRPPAPVHFGRRDRSGRRHRRRPRCAGDPAPAGRHGGRSLRSHLVGRGPAPETRVSSLPRSSSPWWRRWSRGLPSHPSR